MQPPYPIIDAHIHIQPLDLLRPEALAAFGRPHELKRIREMADDPHVLIRHMDEHNIERVGIINYVAPEVMGFQEQEVNAFAARYARAYPDRIIPFGGIDPRNEIDLAQRLDHLIGELGMKGIKIHPPHQLFAANAYRDGGGVEGLATVYEKAAAAGVPVMIHTGTSVFPHARNKYADPMAIDDIAIDFSALQIILAHGGRPIWMDTAYFLLRRHPNVWLDVSSVPPQRLLEYFPWLERVADKAIFGSDWPGPGVPSMAHNAAAFYALPLSEDVKRKLLRENAQRLFGGQHAKEP